MSKIPPEMRRNGRPIVPHFLKDEYLYRRVPLWIWDDDASPLEVSAVELPDISVGRSKLGHPEWLRLDKDRIFEGWGVIGVQVQEVPPERWLQGAFRFRFETAHVPEEWNYPHAEIQAFQGEKHIQLLEELPEEVHLEWRELLLCQVRVFLKPHQSARIRKTAPASHKPELPIPPEDGD